MDTDDNNVQGLQLAALQQKYFTQIMRELDEISGLVIHSSSSIKEGALDPLRVDFSTPKGDSQSIGFAVIKDADNAQQSIEVSWQCGHKKTMKRHAQTESQLKRIFDEVCRDAGMGSVVIYERRQYKRHTIIFTYILQRLGLHTAWERRQIRLRNKKAK